MICAKSRFSRALSDPAPRVRPARIAFRVDLVALPVIEMEMGVDELAYRLVRDPLDLLVESPGRRGLRVGVDHHDPVVRHDHGGIAVGLVSRRRDRRVDAVADLLELEELLVGRLGPRRRGATELVRIEGVDGGRRDPHLCQHLSTRPRLAHRVSSARFVRPIPGEVTNNRLVARCLFASITAAAATCPSIGAIRCSDAPRRPRPAGTSGRCGA